MATEWSRINTRSFVIICFTLYPSTADVRSQRDNEGTQKAQRHHFRCFSLRGYQPAHSSKRRECALTEFKVCVNAFVSLFCFDTARTQRETAHTVTDSLQQQHLGSDKCLLNLLHNVTPKVWLRAALLLIHFLSHICYHIRVTSLARPMGSGIWTYAERKLSAFLRGLQWRQNAVEFWLGLIGRIVGRP